MADFDVPGDLKYAESDEWIRAAGGNAEIGVTDYAQDQLSDVVFVEFPEVGATFEAGETFGVIESVKAASDLMMPVSGEVTAVNEELEEVPENVNEDPYGSWIIRIKITDDSNLGNLMDADAYISYCEARD